MQDKGALDSGWVRLRSRSRLLLSFDNDDDYDRWHNRVFTVESQQCTGFQTSLQTNVR